MEQTDTGIRELELLLDSMLIRIEFLEKEVARLKHGTVNSMVEAITDPTSPVSKALTYNTAAGRIRR